MKKYAILICLGIILICSCKNEEVRSTIPKVKDDIIQYDSIKAQEYGADEYGMKKYIMAFLKSGPNRDRTEEEGKALQAAHMKNIGRLSEEGKLVMAGPFLDGGDIRGIYIFNVESIEEAEALTNTDPAIKAGSLVMELKPWYGSAGLVAIKDIHTEIQKTSF